MATFSSKAEARRVFEDYFRTAHREANGFIYYLPQAAPYKPEVDRFSSGEEEGYASAYSDGSVQEEDRPMPKRGDETPDVELPDLDDFMFEKERKKKKKKKKKYDDGSYVYLPQYRNLYQWRTLTRMPQLVGIGIPYRSPVRPTFPKPNIDDTRSRPLQDRIKRCIEGVKSRIKNKFLDENEMVGDFWVGDGFFTGFADRVYCWKKQGDERKCCET